MTVERCKNCGLVIKKREVEEMIKTLEIQLERLKELKRIMDEGFCGFYCFSKYHGNL